MKPLIEDYFPILMDSTIEDFIKHFLTAPVVIFFSIFLRASLWDFLRILEGLSMLQPRIFFFLNFWGLKSSIVKIFF